MGLANELEPPVPPEEIAAAEAETPKTEAPKDAPKAEEKSKEAPKEETKDEDDGALKFVPHGALHEERQKRKKAQQEFEAYRRQNESEKAVLADRLNQLYAAQQPKPPDPQADPWGNLVHGQQKTAQQLEQVQRRLAQEDQQREHQARIGQMVGWYQQQAAEFEKTAPDFKDAYAHMQKLRVAQIQSLGYTPQQVAQALENDELMVVHNAAQTGQNPAEIIYRMAQNTGWKKPEKVSPEKKMETLQKGVEASKSLGNGGQSSGWPTPDQIASMPEHEFEELKDKLKKSGKRISDLM